MNKKIVINIGANFLGKVVTMLSTYLFVPLYLKYLGNELYGVVSFYTTLQNVMLILGMGLTSTLRKEFAIEENSYRKCKLLKAVEYIYFFIMIIIIFLCFMLANTLISKYINIGSWDFKQIRNAIGLMGISIAFHLVSNLYSGCLLGAGKHISANIWQAIWAVTRSGCAVLVLIFVNVDIILFFLTQIIVDILYVLILRSEIYSWMKKQNIYCNIFNINDFKILKDIIPYTVGLLGISVVSVINTQLDKILVLNRFDFATLGVYNTAASFAQIPNSIVTILMVAIYNEFIAAYSSNKVERYQRVYFSYYQKIYLFLISTVIFMFFFAQNILLFWTASPNMAYQSHIVSKILLIGNFFLGMQQVPYYFLLAVGKTRYNNILGIGVVIVNILLTPIIVERQGIIGAGEIYSLFRLVEFLVLSFVVQKKFIQKKYLSWLCFNIFPPFIMTLILGLGSYKFFSSFLVSNTLIVFLALFSGALVLAVHLLISYKTTYELRTMQIGEKRNQ